MTVSGADIPTEDAAGDAGRRDGCGREIPGVAGERDPVEIVNQECALCHIFAGRGGSSSAPPLDGPRCPDDRRRDSGSRSWSRGAGVLGGGTRSCSARLPATFGGPLHGGPARIRRRLSERPGIRGETPMGPIHEAPVLAVHWPWSSSSYVPDPVGNRLSPRTDRDHERARTGPASVPAVHRDRPSSGVLVWVSDNEERWDALQGADPRGACRAGQEGGPHEA